jgi:hypothetical protein
MQMQIDSPKQNLDAKDSKNYIIMAPRKELFLSSNVRTIALIKIHDIYGMVVNLGCNF